VRSATQERRAADRASAVRRRACIGAALAVLAVALSGCVSLKSNDASQTTPGKVTLTAVACASNYLHAAAPDWTDCQPGNVGKILFADSNREDATQDGFGQMLVGFRVPVGATGPPSFTSKDGAVAFTSSPSYTAELQRLFPASADQQWAGYISTVREYNHTIAATRRGELAVEFKLPTPPGGTPFATFRWREVVGFRQGGNADAPVVCGNDPIGKYCVDSPPAAAVSDDLKTDVSDFGILSGSSVTVYAGTTARVPFQLRYSDKAGLGRKTFGLTAGSELPQSSAVADPRSVDAAPNTTNDATVLVPVPASTPGGRYTVTLSAGIGSPAVTRTNTGTIFVQPLPPGPPPSPILSPVDNQWTPTRSGTTKVDLLVVRNVPSGGVVTARCLRGRGSCAFKSKTFKRRRTVKLTTLFRGRKLKVGTVVEVGITADRRIGKVIQYKVRKGRIPSKQTRCEPPGAAKPLPCD
jgi:hypothetical protein